MISRRALLLSAASRSRVGIAVIVSANAEWREVRKHFPRAAYQRSAFGEYFTERIAGESVVVVQGGWGKVSAAASTQWIISTWNPDVLLNLGTCGGIGGRIKRFETVLATRTAIYDIQEAMGDAEEAIRYYSVELDTRWAMSTTLPLKRAPLLSADRDLIPADIAALVKRYDAIAVDWESGAIAWVASKNNKRVAIVRGVSDLVNPAGGQAYGNEAAFVEGTAVVMKSLLDTLPEWIRLLAAR